MTVTTKKRASIWAYVFAIFIIGIVVVAVVLHMTGHIDLSFIGEGFMGYVAWQAADGMNAVIGAALWITAGILGFYVIKTYIIGTKISTPLQPTYYNPGGQTVSQTTQDEQETVVS